MQASSRKRFYQYIGWTIGTPVLLFLLLTILVYLPPVQKWAVNYVGDMLSEKTGVEVEVKSIRLSFPLRLAADEIVATDTKKDTLLFAKELRLSVELLPLFQGEAKIKGVRLHSARVNTQQLIPDVQISGRIGTLAADAPEVFWREGKVPLGSLRLDKSDLYIQLSDTAKKDSVKTPTKWELTLDEAHITQSHLLLSLPNDSMHIGLAMPQTTLKKGSFDLYRKRYAVEHIVWQKGGIYYDVPHPSNLPLPLLALREKTQGKTAFHQSRAGFDPNHLQLTDLVARIRDFSYDSLGTLMAKVDLLQFYEPSGLHVLQSAGQVHLDQAALHLNNFTLQTPHTDIKGQVRLGLKSPTHYDINIKGKAGYEDILTLAHTALTPYQRDHFPKKPLFVDLAAVGSTKSLRILRSEVQLPEVVKLSASGWIKDMTSPYRKGDLTVDVTALQLRPLLRFVGQGWDKSVQVPSGSRMAGKVGFTGTRYALDLALHAAHGKAKVKGEVDAAREDYHLHVVAQQFPLQRFLPAYTGTAISGTTTLHGKGFDPYSSQTYVDTRLHLHQLHFAGYDLSDLRFDGRLKANTVKGMFRIQNPMIKGEGSTEVALNKRIDLRVDAQFDYIDLHRMKLTDVPMLLGGGVHIQAHTNRAFTTYGVQGNIDAPYLQTATKGTTLSDMAIHFENEEKQLQTRLSAGDLRVSFEAKKNLPALLAHFSKLLPKYERQFKAGHIDQAAIRQDLPFSSLIVSSGSRNPVAAYLRLQGYQWNSLHVNIQTAPTTGIEGFANVYGLRIQSLVIDTLHSQIVTDSTGIQLNTLAENTRKRNPHRFSFLSRAYLLDNGVGIEATYKDRDGRVGVRLGAEGHFDKGGMRFHLYPEKPIVAYRHFTINKDNYLYLSPKGFYSAAIDLVADDGTGLKVYGNPSDTLTDLTVSLHRINLQELSNALPMLPSLGGTFSGDIHWQDNHKEQSFMLDLHTKALKHEGMLLGNVDLQGILLPKGDDSYFTSAFLNVDGEEAAVFNGTYANKKEGYLDGMATLSRLPAKTLNGFLSGTDVLLDGIVNGDIAIDGTLQRPLLNGALDLSEATVHSPVYGFSYQLDTRPLQFSNSLILFDKFLLSSGTEEPLVVDGHVSLKNPTNPEVALALEATNFQLVNAKKTKQSLVYGKIYSHFKGTVRGTAERLSLRGNLSVLPTTDMTYILKDSPLNTEDKLKGLVEFTSFTDTLHTDTIAEAKPSTMDIRLNIDISEAAKFHCELSPDGKSYIDLYGGGTLTFLMTRQGEMRLQGRYTMNKGEMEYELPVFPLKKFSILSGSHINFTGDPMNPHLNITAIETTKAPVGSTGQQRTVEFKTGMVITQTLEKMGLAFTIEAPGDLAITNELNAMTKEEREKVAVAMLATGIYLTESSLDGGSNFKASNALNAFLQGEIQQLAGKALKSIDIRLGVESGTGRTGNTTTDYSFQFSKRFINDRLTIHIGGRVSTGQDAINNGSSFIDNISLEYRLDQVGTRHVRVFYNRDTRDPFEGILTQGGVGLVLRKRTNNLGELFLFRRKKQQP